jgi:putative ABC transport system permease protein
VNARELITLAWRTLRRATLRSALAGLGVIFGVAAVVAMVALGEGAKASVEESVAGLDGNRLNIGAYMPEQPPFGRRPDYVPKADRLTVEDARELQRAFGSTVRVNVQLTSSTKTVKARGRSIESRLMGIEADGLLYESRDLLEGAMFGPIDIREAHAVCVISESLSKALFSGQVARGDVLLIGDVPFKVLGVVSDSARYRDALRPEVGDLSILLPYTSLQRRVNPEAQITIAMRTQNPTQLASTQAKAEEVLEARRGQRKTEFVTINFGITLAAYVKSSRSFALLLGAIAAISLIVGGIGIMNIMLISVMERTREIGIRLALGTLARDVLLQFLLESTALCLAGGLVGVIVGVVAAHILSTLNGWQTLVSFNSVVIAVLVSCGVGIAFGYLPARRAAALRPIQALRSD